MYIHYKHIWDKLTVVVLYISSSIYICTDSTIRMTKKKKEEIIIITICYGCSRSGSNALLFKQIFLNNQGTNQTDLKNVVNVSCNCCYFFLISVDRLTRSVWTGCLKRCSRAVMLLNAILNDQGICTISQDQRSVTIHKLLFNGGLPKNIHCCWSEDSSVSPLFGINRQQICLFLLMFPHLCT